MKAVWSPLATIWLTSNIWPQKNVQQRDADWWLLPTSAATWQQQSLNLPLPAQDPYLRTPPRSTPLLEPRKKKWSPKKPPNKKAAFWANIGCTSFLPSLYFPDCLRETHHQPPLPERDIPPMTLINSKSGLKGLYNDLQHNHWFIGWCLEFSSV